MDIFICGYIEVKGFTVYQIEYIYSEEDMMTTTWHMLEADHDAKGEE